jgi:DNA invertase Pin-like site-specific DNA recombinase
MRRVAIYARVSTDTQTTENQLTELRAVAQRHGWQVAGEFVDHGVSGAKGRDQRPEFDRMLKAAMRREFDLIAAWSVDRLGRSLQNLIEFLHEIHSKKVDLYLHQQGLDTTTPAGKALFQMCGVFAEFERAMIVERVKAGLQRAKTKGTPPARVISDRATDHRGAQAGLRSAQDCEDAGRGCRDGAASCGGCSVSLRSLRKRRYLGTWASTGLPQIPLNLIGEPGFRARACQQRHADRHVGGHRSARIQHARELHPGHAKTLGDLRDRHALGQKFAQHFAGVRWVVHRFHFNLSVVVLIIDQDDVCSLEREGKPPVSA